MTPGEVYLAPVLGVVNAATYRVEILMRPRNGNVLVRWLEGPLAGREARVGAKTLKPLEATK